MRKHAAPLLIVLLLLMPLLYLGSYLVLVTPKDVRAYRWNADFAASFFLPLEHADRRVRRRDWQVGDVKRDLLQSTGLTFDIYEGPAQP